MEIRELHQLNRLLFDRDTRRLFQQGMEDLLKSSLAYQQGWIARVNAGYRVSHEEQPDLQQAYAQERQLINTWLHPS